MLAYAHLELVAVTRGPYGEKEKALCLFLRLPPSLMKAVIRVSGKTVDEMAEAGAYYE